MKHESHIYPIPVMQSLAASLVLALALLANLQCVITTRSAGPATGVDFGYEALTTTDTAEESSIEDPSHSATSESGEDSCYACYELVVDTQAKIAIHIELTKNQSRLIKQKQKQAAEAAIVASHGNSASDHVRKPRLPNQRSNQTRGQTSTRSLGDNQIVVSRLRVARSPSQRSIGDDQLDQISPRITNQKSFKDITLKQIKLKLQRQFNETCKSLHGAQKCLKTISNECVGNLQFHSQEVFTNQWVGKMNCPSYNNPERKLFRGLVRSIPTIHEVEKLPVARRISSEEEVQKRLNMMLPGRVGGNPLGVRLSPRSVVPASRQFHAIGSALVHNPQLASQFNMRGYMIQNKKRDSPLILMTSQLLLISCFLIIVIFIVGLTSRYLRHNSLKRGINQ